MKIFYSKSLMLIASLFISISASAFDFEVDGIYYDSIRNLTCRVTFGNNQYFGDVVIPSTVVYNNQTYSVTSIGSSAFSDCSSLTSVTIPNSVTSIGNGAFSECSGLASISIPNSVTSIGNRVFSKCSGLASISIPNGVTSIGGSAFSGCSSLTSIAIPNSVTLIEESAFSGCSGLTSVTIPNSVTSIGKEAFSKCSGLMKFVVESNNLNYSDIDGVLCSKDKTILISYPNAKGSKYDIPNSITSIGDGAFNYCSSLTSVTIPNSVTSIGGSAFSGCSSLTSVSIPNSVTSIRENTFNYCSSLTSVTIPNSVTLIGKSAFAYCRSLTSVAIPNSVTLIGEGAFGLCSLTSVTIGKSVRTIGRNAFSFCNSITTINSLNPTPPTGCGFEANVYSNATLNIPDGSLSAYKAAAGWKEFLNIKEVDFSGVEQITNDDVKVIVKSNEIEISGVDESAKVEIYNMNGMLIYSGFDKAITAPTAGIYIVKVANKTLKVAIN